MDTYQTASPSHCKPSLNQQKRKLVTQNLSHYLSSGCTQREIFIWNSTRVHVAHSMSMTSQIVCECVAACLRVAGRACISLCTDYAEWQNCSLKKNVFLRKLRCLADCTLRNTRSYVQLVLQITPILRVSSMHTVIHMRLILSGDVELNPGPKEGKHFAISTLIVIIVMLL